MVNVTIDGKSIQIAEGTTVLRAAEQAGVNIPVLCDHPHLVPFGGCRLCVVDVEGMRTLQPACSLPVSNNMVVHTNTEKVLAARKFVLTLIFSDRNHFCPYCQVSGGDCELQNAALDLGMTHWEYQPNWKPYPVDASHPYLVLDHNRCILCRRCVRACSELVGNSTLGVEERGASSMLVCDVGVPFGESSCISCGTCSQVCPTGAIIDRRSAYQGLDKKVTRTASICVGCSVGCGIEVLTRDNRLVRILGRWDAPVNEGIVCKQGRFLPLDEERARIATPLVKKDGKQVAASWDEALQVAAAGLTPLVGKNGSGVAAVTSDRLTVESLAAFKKLFKDGFHSDMVTTLGDGEGVAVAADVAAELGAFSGSLESLASADCVVVMGVDLTAEEQVVGFMVKRILQSKTALVLIDSEENGLAPFSHVMIKMAAGAEKATLEAVQKALKDGSAADEEVKHAAALISKATHPVFVYGKRLNSAALKTAVELAKSVNGSLVGSLTGANSLAAAQLGLGKIFKLNGHQAVFVALGDDTPSQQFVQSVEKAPFLVVQASHVSRLTAVADVVLPVEMWAETSGHYLNLEGRLQESVAALKPAGEVISSLEALKALAAKVGLSADADWQAEITAKTSPVQLTLA